MLGDYQDRMVDPPLKRKRGRPPKNRPPEPVVEAEPLVLSGVVLPCVCPWCGRGQQPRVRSTNGDTRYCDCALCGKPLIYRAATISRG